MGATTVHLRNVPGTNAAMGWAGSHTLVIDRAEGRAGGMGLGFNGAEMIALAIGGCFCNDLRYVADAEGIALTTIEVDVIVHLDGNPLLVTSAELRARVVADETVEIPALIRRTEAISAITNSVRRGFPVSVQPV